MNFIAALAGSGLVGSDFDINWLVDGVNQTANAAMPALAGGFYGTVYNLRMNAQQSNTVTVDMRPVTIATGATRAWEGLVTNGELGAGLHVDSLGQVAFNWELAEGLTNPGSNYMQVIDITVIPELSCSTALLGLGALALAFKRRKR